MEHNQDSINATYGMIARRTLEVAPFLSTFRNTKINQYSKVVGSILRKFKKPVVSTQKLFAANRKIFHTHTLSRIAIAALPADAYMDAQIDSEGLLRTLDIEIFESKRGLGHKLYLAIKRTFDIFVGLIGCIILVPLTIFVKLGNILTGDFAPVFYKTKRIGQNGKQFDFFKFRSMIRTKDGRNAEYLVEEMLEKHPELREQWETTRKLDNDPRITKMGKIIRKLSIDEVPQFFNILRGDMSLIGPRPLMIGELDEHYGSHTTYEAVKPGLIGWWAANGRSDVEYNKRLQLEYYYVNNQSLALDTKIIFKTAISMLKGTGVK